MALGHREGEDGGLTVRQLGTLFLALVAVCAVFFALGFLVGRSRQASNPAPLSQQITPVGDVPPTVNPPQQQRDSPGPQSETEPAWQPARSASRAQDSARTSVATSDVSSGIRLGRRPTSGHDSANSTARKDESRVDRAGITVQVAASSVLQDAQALVEVLRERGYAAYLMAPSPAHATDWLYRVEVGPFPSRQAAELTLKKLTAEGFRPFIRR